MPPSIDLISEHSSAGMHVLTVSTEQKRQRPTLSADKASAENHQQRKPVEMEGSGVG